MSDSFWPLATRHGPPATLKPQSNIVVNKALRKIVIVVAGLAVGEVVLAQQPQPLYEQSPRDRILLDARNDNKVLLVEPLAFPDRRTPVPLPKKGTLTVRLLDQPDPPYEIQWAAIVRIDLFEEMILADAKGLVRAGRLDQALDHFTYLHQNYPKLPGLKEAFDEYLFAEAGQFDRQGDYAGMLAMLREMYDRGSRRPELPQAMGRAIDKLAEQYAAAGNYPAARALLDGLVKCYPEHPVAARWYSRFRAEAGAARTEAETAAEAGRWRDADRAARRMVDLWPETPGAGTLLQAIHERYPRVVVGVASPATTNDPNRFDDWAARRTSRLVYRTLTEFVGPSTEGGKYVCPLGEMRAEDLNRRLVITLRPEQRWSSGPAVLTGYDVSQRLLAMADPRSAIYRIEWAEILSGVSVEDVYAVKVSLRRAHVRPEAFLQVPVLPFSGQTPADEPTATNGPYCPAEHNDKQTSYLINTQYLTPAAASPKEIVERYYPRGSQAIAALRRGEIDVLDRVNPWDLEKLRGDKNVVVHRYAVPLVHCLVPNLRRPLPAQRMFRRALVYAIQREAILKRLLGGRAEPGCQVVSGPFSRGIALEDPLDYAYDKTIAPRPYNPRLAVALAAVALQEAAARERASGEKLQARLDLVLAYPRDEIAQMAVTAIQRQLKLVGITVRLEELPSGAPPRVPDSADFLYAELAMWEPVINARRLLGEEGMSGGASAYMGLALRNLEQAADWSEVGHALREIHRLAHVEAAVIPLYQLTDHFARRRTLEGVGESPVTLYQNVEQWKAAFHVPAESP